MDMSPFSNLTPIEVSSVIYMNAKSLIMLNL